EHLVVVVRRAVADALAAPGDREAAGGGGAQLVGEEPRQLDGEAARQLHHAVIGRRELGVLDLREGRDREAGTGGKLLQRQAGLAAEPPDPPGERRYILRTRG